MRGHFSGSYVTSHDDPLPAIAQQYQWILDVHMHILIHGTRALNTGAVLYESLQEDFAYVRCEILHWALWPPVPVSLLAHKAKEAHA